MKDPEQIHRRYHDLESHVTRSDEDAARVRGLRPLLEPHFPALIEDFHAEIARHAGHAPR